MGMWQNGPFKTPNRCRVLHWLFVAAHMQIIFIVTVHHTPTTLSQHRSPCHCGDAVSCSVCAWLKEPKYQPEIFCCRLTRNGAGSRSISVPDREPHASCPQNHTHLTFASSHDHGRAPSGDEQTGAGRKWRGDITPATSPSGYLR